MASARARHGTFLFQRPGSNNYYVRLRHDGKRIERSLGTSDKQQALTLAWPMIGEHKRKLAETRLRLVTTWVPAYPPGLHTGPDGERIFATERELHFLDADNRTVRTEANGSLGRKLENLPMGAVIHFGNPTRPVAELRRVFGGPVIDVSKIEGADETRPTVAAKSGDDLLLETYIKHANLPEHRASEARDIWATFRALVKTPLHSCTRADGRVLVDFFKDQGNKIATIHRKLVPLNAMCKLAVMDGKLKLNPFSGVVAKKGDNSMTKLKFNDDDMSLIRANLDKTLVTPDGREIKLRASDQLLVRVLASTGMRLAEPFQIKSEEREQGVRYVIVQSLKGKSKLPHRRRVPLPTELNDLPKITGPLFRGASADAGKRINPWLREIGITDKAKTTHSFRHRAGARLDAAQCPSKVRDALLGHGAEDDGESYGADGIRGGSHPITTLREWIDRIGF